MNGCRPSASPARWSSSPASSSSAARRSPPSACMASPAICCSCWPGRSSRPSACSCGNGAWSPTRAMVVTSVVSLAILPVYGLLVGFGRMIALGLWENLLQAVAAGPACRTRRDLPVHPLRRAARRRAGGGVSDAGAALRAADRLDRAGQSAERAAIDRPGDRADRIPADPARLAMGRDRPESRIPCLQFAHHLVAGRGHGSRRPARHAGRADHHAAGDAADRADVDLAADPVRRHRAGGARRLGLRRRRSAAGSIWCRRRWAGRPICASSSAR